MPVNYARSLVGRQRTAQGNRHLGYALTFVAGATNAGGFLALSQYTSHMTGIVSSMADELALGHYPLLLAGASALMSFVLGAASSAVMINFARRRRLHSEYALPLLLEAALLLVFGLLGTSLAATGGQGATAAVVLLCFIMGLQNAVVSKLSRAEIRTTHITGMVTDIGIELGKLVYWNGIRPDTRPSVVADRARLRVLCLMVAFFFVGGVVGAVGFKQVGFASTIALAATLAVLAVIPAFDDVAERMHRSRSA